MQPFVSSPQVLPQYDRDLALPGVVAPMLNGPLSVSTVTPTANQLYIARFVPSRVMAIIKIAFSVTTAANSNDSLDAGLYDASGNRLVSAGATTGKANATGIQSITVASTTLSPNVVYYAALAYGAVGGTAATFQAVTFSGSGVGNQFFGTAMPNVLYGRYASGTLSSTVATTPTTNSSAPILAALES